MTQRQIDKLCRLSQVLAMKQFKKPQDALFVRKPEYQSDDYKLSAFVAEKLNKVYLDNAKVIKRLERMQL
jgi:hypothetical protein